MTVELETDTEVGPSRKRPVVDPGRTVKPDRARSLLFRRGRGHHPGHQHLDPGYELGVPDEFLLGAFVGFGGLLAGITTGLFAGRRGWGLAVPSGVGLAVGVAVFVILNALRSSTSFSSDIPIWVIWAAQSVGNSSG